MSILETKEIEQVYNAVLAVFSRAAKAQGRNRADAEDVAVEAVARLMEQRHEIDKPLHWAMRTAGNLWRDIGRRDYRHVSYEGVEGVSRDKGTWRIHNGDDTGEDKVNGPAHEKHKTHVHAHVKNEMAGAVMESRSPETIVEQRDLLQKIDPDWLEHMEEGVDFSPGKRLDRNLRRQIQRRAKALLEGGTC